MRPAIYNLLANKIPEPDFDAPLVKSLELRRGVGSATFTRASTATVFGYAPDAMPGDAQVMLTVNSNEARFEGARRVSAGVWDDKYADGTPISAENLKGYVAEGARTNLVTYSEQFDASWGKSLSGSGVVVTPNNVVAPSGATTADLITESSGSAFHAIYQNTTITSGVTYTGSVYIKAGTRRYVELSVGPLGPTSQKNFGVVVDTTTMTIASTGSGSLGTYISSSITPVLNGFYRVTVTGSIVDTNGYLGLAGMDSSAYSTSPSSSGSQTWYQWGAQIEAASFASSYIRTTTASVTRNADVLTYPTAGNFSDTAGSAYAEPIAESWANATGQYLGDSSGSPLQSSASNSGVQVYDGTNTANGPSGSPSGQMKVASSWRDFILKAFANGNKGTDGSYGQSFGLSQLDIGDSFFGNMRNLKLWKKSLSDRNLLEITK